MAGNDHAVCIDNDWLAKTELLNRIRNGLDRFIIQKFRVLLVWSNLDQRPLLDDHGIFSGLKKHFSPATNSVPIPAHSR
jgi:hypothetical protein